MEQLRRLISEWLRRVRAARAPIFSLPAASFVLIVLALYAFAEIADGIGPNDDLHLFDRAVATAVTLDPGSGAHAFFGAVTHFGDGPLLTLIGIAVGVKLLYGRAFIPLYAWVVALAGSGLINNVLKHAFERARPGETPLLGTWSFPSGHAMNSLVAYGMLVYVAWRIVPRGWRPALAAGAATIVLAVGASRVVLGYHWFTDVVGGWVAGLAWMTVCVTACELGLQKRATRL